MTSACRDDDDGAGAAEAGGSTRRCSSALICRVRNASRWLSSSGAQVRRQRGAETRFHLGVELRRCLDRHGRVEQRRAVALPDDLDEVPPVRRQAVGDDDVETMPSAAHTGGFQVGAIRLRDHPHDQPAIVGDEQADRYVRPVGFKRPAAHPGCASLYRSALSTWYGPSRSAPAPQHPGPAGAADRRIRLRRAPFRWRSIGAEETAITKNRRAKMPHTSRCRRHGDTLAKTISITTRRFDTGDVSHLTFPRGRIVCISITTLKRPLAIKLV